MISYNTNLNLVNAPKHFCNQEHQLGCQKTGLSTSALAGESKENIDDMNSRHNTKMAHQILPQSEDLKSNSYHNPSARYTIFLYHFVWITQYVIAG